MAFHYKLAHLPPMNYIGPNTVPEPGTTTGLFTSTFRETSMPLSNLRVGLRLGLGFGLLLQERVCGLFGAAQVPCRDGMQGAVSS
jgi:hypothetical protein